MSRASSREVLRHLSTLFHCGAAGQFSDAELLERFVTGAEQESEAAFAALVERHGGMVLGVCRRVLGSRDGAEDAFQATFLVLAKKALAIARREQLASWLHGVARRAALDVRARAVRRSAREKRFGAMLPVEPPDPTIVSEVRAILDDELAQLPERHQAALVLCELEGLSRRDAAIRLGISEGTLSSRLARAKTRLRDRLIRRGFALSAAAVASLLTEDAHAVVVSPMLVDSTIRVATLFAAGLPLSGAVSTSVATLTEGVLKAMLLAKVKFAFLCVITLALVSTSAGVLAQDGPGRATASDDDRFKSLERKLDKLLEVLVERSGRPVTTALPIPGMAPVGTSAAPGPQPSPTPALAPVPPLPATTPVARGRGGRFGATVAIRHEQLDVPSRFDLLERRLAEVERRLSDLERRLHPNSSGPDMSPRPKVGSSDLQPPPTTAPPDLNAGLPPASVQYDADTTPAPAQPTAPPAPPPPPGNALEPTSGSADVRPVSP
jgi:RNA polymerase sigma-70 factor (ECF subfamily)